MDVLVVGGGGREHTLVLSLERSETVDTIYSTAESNVGITRRSKPAACGEDGPEAIARWADENGVDLTIVGPEGPLVEGIVDAFNKHNLRIFGPGRKAAELEGSKVFAKRLMKKYGIPTADFEVFSSADAAGDYVRQQEGPLVVKADGLAGGKGVFVCETEKEALAAVEEIMCERAFGQAGERVVIEELLCGEEASVLALTDGRTVLPLESAQDHKPAYDGDRGPNTGGMGAYSPAPVINETLQAEILDEILIPTVRAMEAEGRPFSGVLYAGLMITEQGPQVLEFNVRFGDPEAQAVLPRLKTDLCELCMAVVEQRLADIELTWDRRTAVCVVLASGGYPGEYETGKEIRGLEEAEDMEGVLVIHAGTEGSGREVRTAGGRVLGITALAEGHRRAIKRAYDAVECVDFEDMHYRTDIGAKALEHLD